MNYLKRSFALVMLFCLLTNISACKLFKKSGGEKTTVRYEDLKGEFTYQESGELVNLPYIYNDGYFFGDPTVYNKELATFGMCLNLAMTPSTTLDKKSRGIINFLTGLGFSEENMACEELDGVNRKDGIGTLIASKNVDGLDIVIVCVRGVGYTKEFIGNFVVGGEGNSAGFEEPSKEVEKRIKKYVADRKLKEYKLFMVGYSRGGAVCDLAAYDIYDHSDEFGLKKKDFYAYTYEAPKALLEGAPCPNIHNVVDNRDLVPYLVFGNWGFKRAGVLHLVGSHSKLINSRYLGILGISNGPQVELCTFYEDFEDWFSTCITRKEYSEDAQETVYNLMHLVFDRDGERAKALDIYMDEINEELGSNVLRAKLLYYFYDYVDLSKKYDYDASTEFLQGVLKDVREKGKSGICDEDFEIISSSVKPLLMALREAVADDYHTKVGKKEYRFYHFATLLNLADEIYEFHALERFITRMYEDDGRFY